MTLPNFIIIGAAKCGTTALYEYLKQHPQVYMSEVKEPRFFALDGEELSFGGPLGWIANKTSINDLAAYHALFEDVGDEKAVGEASTLYLYHPRAAERIQYYVPDVRMIAILRDPVERAYSAYMMHVMQQRESLSFEEAIAAEPARIRENWIYGRYVDVGRYAEQLDRYFQLFDRQQIAVYFFEDFKANPAAVVQDIFKFIGVDADHQVDLSLRHNVSGVPQNRLIDALIGQRPTRYWTSRFRRFVPKRLLAARDRLRQRNLSKPPLDREVRNRLLPLFREDVLRLEDMLGRDLSTWRM